MLFIYTRCKPARVLVIGFFARGKKKKTVMSARARSSSTGAAKTFSVYGCAKIHSRSPTLRAPPRFCPTVFARKSGYPASDRSSDSSSRRSKRIHAKGAARATTAAASLSLSETISLTKNPKELRNVVLCEVVLLISLKGKMVFS